MDIWYTWLGYLGLLAGLIFSAFAGWPPLRSALAGFVAGIAFVTFVNVMDSKPAPDCLQNARGWDILRTYSLKCPDPDDLVRR
ncbi:MAG: hypothetical protein AB1342_12200 [Pseudomonadota bacterium]